MKNNSTKKNTIFRTCLNPGIIFIMLFLATAILITKHKAGINGPDIKPSNKNTQALSNPPAYTSDSNWNSATKVPIAVKDNLYSTNTIFKDATLESGIEFMHVQAGMMLNAISEVVGPGACTADYDNDGFLDIYAVNGAGYTHYYGKKWWWQKGPYNTLYHNNGDGTFNDTTKKTGVGDSGWGMGCAFGDYDNDGNPDLYVTNYGANVLYHNNGDGTFADVTEKAGVGDNGWGTSLAWSDYDNDGDLDIYVANYIVFDKTMNPDEPNSAFKINMPLLMNSKLFDGQENVLYRNNGDGTFTNVTMESGVSNAPGKSMGVVFSDFNNDGYQDLYITNDKSRNVLYLNNRIDGFTDAGGAFGVDSPLSGMGVSVGDYDNDGDMDIFSTYTQKDTNILYNNNLFDDKRQQKRYDHLKFTNTTVDAGIGEDVSVGYFGWGTEFIDYDNDGHLDIFVANGHGMPDFDNPRATIGQRNQLFRNNGDGMFKDVSGLAGSGFKLMNSSRGCALGDYDNDGDVDVFVVNNNGYATLLMNEVGNINNWLNIKLTGTTNNRDALGARVKVVADSLTQTKEVRSGSGYLSQNDVRLNFGLGKNTNVDLVEVKWPNGLIEKFTEVKVNQFVNIIEGKGLLISTDKVKKPHNDLPVKTKVQREERTIDTEIKRQALIALGNIGDERAIKPLLLCLRDMEACIRREAVKALRYFDSDMAIGPIIMALEDSNAGVRTEAAATLGYLMKKEQTIHKASIQRKRLAVIPLLKSLEDDDFTVRREAIRALGFSESYRACIPVTRMLDDTAEEVRKDATVALGLLRDKRAIERLIKVLKDPNEACEVRAKAVISLNRLESKITIGPLIRALENEDCEIRQKAASVFASLFKDKEGVVLRKAQTIKHLVKALDDNDPLVRQEVIKALGYVKNNHIITPLIKSLSDKDAGVRQMALKTLGPIGKKETLPYIINALGDLNHNVRKEAVIALSSMGNNTAIQYLINAMEDDNAEVRKQAIVSMGGFRNKEIINVLLDVIKNENEDQDVRVKAFSSLNKIGTDIGLEILVELLNNSNIEIRKEAASYLGKYNNKRYKDNRTFYVLAKVLLKTDEDAQVRSAVVSSLSSLRHKKALLLLLKILKNRGDNVRLEIIKALGGFKDELALKHLMMIIKNEHEETQLRSEAVIAISKMDRKEVFETLTSLIQPLS